MGNKFQFSENVIWSILSTCYHLSLLLPSETTSSLVLTFPWKIRVLLSISSYLSKSSAIPKEQTTKLLFISKSSMSLFVHRNECCYHLEGNMLNDRMASRDLATATIFLSQMIAGILGNFSLLYHYLCHYHTEDWLKPTDLLLKHLIIANSLLMLSKGVAQTLAAFGLKYFFHDSTCKLLLYVQRVGRRVSSGNICLLWNLSKMEPMGIQDFLRCLNVGTTWASLRWINQGNLIQIHSILLVIAF